MKLAYVGLFFALVSCGSGPRDLEMEEVEKIVLQDEESPRGDPLDRQLITEAEKQEGLLLLPDPEEVWDEE